jgi:hypothetical protein
MAEPKTKPTEVSAKSHIAAIVSESNGVTPRFWSLSCEELPGKNHGCGGQASSDSGATITSTLVVTYDHVGFALIQYLRI